MNIRELILDMLMEMEKGKVYSNILIRNVLDKYDYLPAKDKAFVKRVTEGVLERRIQIDYIINAFAKIPVEKMKPLIRNLIRMSVYQLLFMDTVPDAAVCNEAVKLAAKRKFQPLKGFVNGVLRNIARRKGELAIDEQPENGNDGVPAVGHTCFYPDKREYPLEYLSVAYSMPEYFIRDWMKDYGMERTKKMLQAMLEIHPVTIRLKESLSMEEKKELLGEMGKRRIEATPHPYLPYAYRLNHVDGVRNIPGFDRGMFAVQDVSSMLCIECAGIKEGCFVVDVCAAPGGKSLHGAEKAGAAGQVLARDISAEKVALIEENARRQGFGNIRAEVFDALQYDSALEEKADVVLADVPCSGLGILGRKRDIKYNMTKEMLSELPGIQREILSTVWHYVRPGGILVYSTCTIRKEENEENFRWFLEQFPFTAEDISEKVGHIPEAETAADGFLQLLPGIHETDGFFIGVFRRKIVPVRHP